MFQTALGATALAAEYFCPFGLTYTEYTGAYFVRISNLTACVPFCFSNMCRSVCHSVLEGEHPSDAGVTAQNQDEKPKRRRNNIQNVCLAY